MGYHCGVARGRGQRSWKTWEQQCGGRRLRAVTPRRVARGEGGRGDVRGGWEKKKKDGNEGEGERTSDEADEKSDG